MRWDNYGFILATKKLMEEMRFQWPKDPEGVIDISSQELRWLLEGFNGKLITDTYAGYDKTMYFTVFVGVTLEGTLLKVFF